jgi:hypothetical protein
MARCRCPEAYANPDDEGAGQTLGEKLGAVPVNQRPGGEPRLERILMQASQRAAASLVTARGLLEAGYPSPAYVWAVRTIEIFVKEFMLLPYFLTESNGDWTRAWREVKSTFESAKWTRAVRLVNEVYGPLDPMLTEDGRDVWDEWKRYVVSKRGALVHGVDEASAEEAALVVQWADQMITQLKLRLIVARRHPFHDIFMAILERARAAMGDGEESPRLET